MQVLIILVIAAEFCEIVANLFDELDTQHAENVCICFMHAWPSQVCE